MLGTCHPIYQRRVLSFHLSAYGLQGKNENNSRETERCSRLSGNVGAHKCRGVRRARSTAQLQHWEKALQHNVSASLVKPTGMAGFWSNQWKQQKQFFHGLIFFFFVPFFIPSSRKIKMMTPSSDDSIKYMHTPIHVCVCTHICLCVHVWTCIDANTPKDTLFIQHMSYQKTFYSLYQ